MVRLFFSSKSDRQVWGSVLTSFLSYDTSKRLTNALEFAEKLESLLKEHPLDSLPWKPELELFPSTVTLTNLKIVEALWEPSPKGLNHHLTLRLTTLSPQPTYQTLSQRTQSSSAHSTTTSTRSSRSQTPGDSSSQLSTFSLRPYRE